MLNEDSHPDSDEYEAPRDVETLAQQGAEPPTGEQPEGTQHRGGDANGQQRCDERSVQHGQRDADRERVNARGKRQQQHDSEPEEVALATILASPELELRGVTTVGADAHKRAQMASRFLTAVGHGKKDFVAAGLPEKTTKPLPYW